MICEKVLGSIRDESVHAQLAARLGGYVVEDVPFTWDEAHKRVQRKVGSEGTEVGIRLDEETRRRGIRDDDVLGVDSATQHVLVARITPEDAVAVAVEGADPLTVARVAWEVGNTHTPLFAGAAPGTFVFPLNEPLRDALERIPGVTAEVRRAVLDPGRLVSSAEAGHGHDHAHGHAHAHADARGDAHGHEAA